MHNVTCISHQMQKHKFSIMGTDALLVESVPVKPKHENSASMFHSPNALECAM
jgi:hypothetical protein